MISEAFTVLDGLLEKLLIVMCRQHHDRWFTPAGHFLGHTG